MTPPPQPTAHQELPTVPEQPTAHQDPLPAPEQSKDTVPEEQVLASNPQPVEADKFDFDLSLDPGDPVNSPKVRMLKPLHDGSNLVGFAVGNADYASKWADTPPGPKDK